MATDEEFWESVAAVFNFHFLWEAAGLLRHSPEKVSQAYHNFESRLREAGGRGVVIRGTAFESTWSDTDLDADSGDSSNVDHSYTSTEDNGRPQLNHNRSVRSGSSGGSGSVTWVTEESGSNDNTGVSHASDSADRESSEHRRSPRKRETGVLAMRRWGASVASLENTPPQCPTAAWPAESDSEADAAGVGGSSVSVASVQTGQLRASARFSTPLESVYIEALQKLRACELALRPLFKSKEKPRGLTYDDVAENSVRSDPISVDKMTHTFPEKVGLFVVLCNVWFCLHFAAVFVALFVAWERADAHDEFPVVDITWIASKVDAVAYLFGGLLRMCVTLDRKTLVSAFHSWRRAERPSILVGVTGALWVVQGHNCY